jgi:hypothetical protein
MLPVWLELVVPRPSQHTGSLEPSDKCVLHADRPSPEPVLPTRGTLSKVFCVRTRSFELPRIISVRREAPVIVIVLQPRPTTKVDAVEMTEMVAATYTAATLQGV